jgi:hypothetical protein
MISNYNYSTAQKEIEKDFIAVIIPADLPGIFSL